MHRVEMVRNQAAEARKVFNDFLTELEQDRTEFLASFHLRPTSGERVTIVSTLPSAPMRGISCSLIELPMKLRELRDVLGKSSEDDQRKLLKGLGFEERKTRNFREEDAQAAFIRNAILHPNGMIFVASEFVLFGFEDTKGETAKPDVLMYQDGVLYDIEFKNKRNAPKEGDIRRSSISQAQYYAAHMNDSERIETYANCLYDFPNAAIGTIKAVRGIAFVPKPAVKSAGILEKAAKAAGVGLWEFGSDGSMSKVVE